MKNIFLLLLMLSSSVWSQSARLDDSGTHAMNPLKIEFKNRIPDKSGADPLMIRVMLRVNLDMRQHVGRQGRIFMVLPSQPAGNLQARWGSVGRIQGGEVRSGQRALIYAGKIDQPLFVETMNIEIETNEIMVNNPNLTILFDFEAS